MPARVVLTTPAFPPAPPDPFAPNGKLQDALDKFMAVAVKTHKSLGNVGIAIAELGTPGAHAVAHHKGDVVYFGASTIKVAALYGMYQLRTTLRAIAAELGTATSKSELLTVAARHLKPKIMAAVKKLPALKHASSSQAIPKYTTGYQVVPAAGGTFTVEFSKKFAPSTSAPARGRKPVGHLEKMIVVSNNSSAAQCIRACGYGYLNGALTAAGCFEPGTGKKGVGVWLASDYAKKGSAGKYSSYPIKTATGSTGMGSSPLHLVRLLTLLDDGELFDKDADARTGMLDALAKCAAYPEVWINRADPDLHFTVSHNKLGVAKSQYSECTIVEHDGGQRFALAWFNLRWGDAAWDELDALAQAVRDTLDEYLAP